MHKPIHVATLAGQPLRFFRTPSDDGRPDLPWHAVEDLWRCLGLNRAQRHELLRQMRLPAEVQTIATPDGIVTVAPHFVAQGTIDDMIEMGLAPAKLSVEYDCA